MHLEETPSSLRKLMRERRFSAPSLYYECIDSVYSVLTPHDSPAMHGMAATIFSDNRLIAHNLIQNSIDEARGAARVYIMAHKYAEGNLSRLMLAHVEDELRHADIFRALVELTGFQNIHVDVNGSGQEISSLKQFDDDLRQFICRVHSIELRSWKMLQIYIDVLEKLGPRYAKAVIALKNIMADEVNHVFYTGRQVSTYLSEDSSMVQTFVSCMRHTSKETWNDLANMATYLSNTAEPNTS